MPLLYRARRSALKTKDGKNQWYPSLVKVGKAVDSQELGELIAEKSSLSPGDVHNVIRTLMSTIRHELLSSRSVQLDGLGTFRMIIHANGTGVDTFDEVSHKQVNKLTVHFSPAYTINPDGSRTRTLYEDASYERIDTKFLSVPVTPGTFSIADVTLNGTSIAAGSGALSVASGDTLQISGSRLTDITFRASVTIGGITGTTSTVDLSGGVGTVTDSSETSIAVSVTINGEINSLMRADDGSIIFSFE
jgi:predicted histone-like DNA-binding protein